MGVEDYPDHHPYPEPSEDWESFFLASLESLTDTIFSHDAIEERQAKVQGTEREAEIGAFIRCQKRSLENHLEETIELAIVNILADLNRIQTTLPLPGQIDAQVGARPIPSPAPSKTEPQPQITAEQRHKPFPIASVCREDLQEILADEEIAGLSDTDMQTIADKMAEAYITTNYWDSLEEAIRYFEIPLSPNAKASG